MPPCAITAGPDGYLAQNIMVHRYDTRRPAGTVLACTGLGAGPQRPFMAGACQRTSYVFRETGWGVWVVPPAYEPPSCPLGQQRRQPVDGEGFAPRQHLGERQPDLGPRPVELFRDRVGSTRRGVDADVEASIRWWAGGFAAEALEKSSFWGSSPVRHEHIVALCEAGGSSACEGSAPRIDCPLRRPPGPIWILGRELSKSLLLLTQHLPRSHPPTIAILCAAPDGTVYDALIRGGRGACRTTGARLRFGVARSVCLTSSGVSSVQAVDRLRS